MTALAPAAARARRAAHGEAAWASLREAGPDEVAGRPVVVRAAVAGIAGGVLVAVVAGSFGPRFFATDVRAWGIGLGVLAVLVLLGPLTGTRVFPGTGQLLMLVAVLAVPVAAGGFAIGSLLLLGAGVVLASLAPAPGAVVVAGPAGPLRRAAALVVDAGLTVVAVVVLATTVLPGVLDGGDGVYLLWAGVWLLVTVPLAVLTGSTPGHWLVQVRLARAGSGGRAPGWRVAGRQLLRGLVAVGGLLAVLIAWAGWDPAAAAAAALAALAAAVTTVLPGVRWLDALTSTTPLASRTVAPRVHDARSAA